MERESSNHRGKVPGDVCKKHTISNLGTLAKTSRATSETRLVATRTTKKNMHTDKQIRVPPSQILIITSSSFDCNPYDPREWRCAKGLCREQPQDCFQSANINISTPALEKAGAYDGLRGRLDSPLCKKYRDNHGYEANLCYRMPCVNVKRSVPFSPRPSFLLAWR